MVFIYSQTHVLVLWQRASHLLPLQLPPLQDERYSPPACWFWVVEVSLDYQQQLTILSLLCVPVLRVNISHNHRIIYVGKDLEGHLVQPLT